jgi:hypothetical protein
MSNLKNLLEQAKIMKNVSDMPLNVLNGHITQAEIKARNAIANIKAFQDQFPLVNSNYDEVSTIANYIKASIGRYKKPEYVSEFGAYTARFHGDFLVHYAIRDNFYGYLPITQAEINKDSIMFPNCAGESRYKSPFGDGVEIVKECKNGNLYLKKTAELVELVEIIQSIEAKYNKIYAERREIK